MHFRTVAVALILLLTASPAPARNPLVAAVQDRDLGELKQLLADNPDWLEWKDKFYDEATPLQEAVYSSFKEGVDLLLERGARLDLFSAAGLGRTRDVDALLKADPLLIRARSRGGWTALHWACWHGRTATVARLLAHKAPVDGRDGEGRTPLCYAAQNGHIETAALLLKNKAAVNARGPWGVTPLHLAAGAAQEKTVRLLLAHGANANARTRHEETPLHYLLDPLRRDGLYPFSAPVRGKDPAGVAALLIAHKVDLSPDNYIDRPAPGVAALCCNGMEDARKLILRHCSARDVFQAAFLGELKRVKTLIEEDAGRASAAGPQKRTALHWAAEQGHEAVVRFLLSRDARADARDENAQSPLDLAVARGHLALVKRLASVPGPRGQVLRDQALFAAVTADRKQVLEALLECGADLRATQGKDSLLHHAVLEGNRQLVQWLLARKLSPSAKGDRGQTPLHRAMECGNEALAELLLRAGAEVDAVDQRGRTALHIAANRGCTGLVKLLVQHKARVNVRDAAGMTTLHWAAYYGQKETVALLLALKADPNARTKDGLTPLHLPHPRVVLCGTALFSGDNYFSTGPVDFAQTVRLLLKHGADLRARTNAGHTPIDYVPDLGASAAVLRLLFDAGGTGDAVHIAEGGRAEHMRRLLRDDPTLLRARLAVGLSLLYRAALAGNSETAGILVDALQGADKKRALAEALVTAARSGHRQLAEALLDRGADVNARDRGPDGNTALHEAAAEGKEQVVSLLLARSADIRLTNKKKQTALHLAAGNGQEKAARLLLARGGPVEARDSHGRTPLHSVFLGDSGLYARGPMRVLRLLLRGRADPNARDADGKTPLHLAASSGDGEAVTRLLRSGAAVNATDEKGATPLDCVSAEDAAEVAPLLRAPKRGDQRR